MKKMKKLIALASCMVLGASACASLAGCGGKGSDYLEVVVLSAGYGDEWIEISGRNLKKRRGSRCT